MRSFIFRSRNIFSDDRGFSLSEILVVTVLAGLVGIAMFQAFRGTGTKSEELDVEARLTQNLNRVMNLIKTDVARAGSDPTQNALWAWRMQGGSCDYIRFRDVGINPYPTKRPPDCLVLGDIEILSYNMYDANGDGVISIDEGIDYSSTTPALKLESMDNIVWAWRDSDTDGYKDSLYRINAGSVLDDADDQVMLALDHVVNFSIRYFGIGTDGEYGDITGMGRDDFIRSIQFTIEATTGKDIVGYTNPNLPAGHPYIHQKSKRVRFMASPKIK